MGRLVSGNLAGMKRNADRTWVALSKRIHRKPHLRADGNGLVNYMGSSFGSGTRLACEGGAGLRAMVLKLFSLRFPLIEFSTFMWLPYIFLPKPTPSENVIK